MTEIIYLVHCTKNTKTEEFDLFQLGGLQNTSMNFGAFFSWTQRLKAL